MFKAKHLHILTLIFSFSSLFSQKNAEISSNQASELTEKPASKVLFTEDPAVPVKLSGSHYDPLKKNLPYFQQLKAGKTGTVAKATLKNVKTVVLGTEASQKLLNIYKEFIGSDFSIETENATNRKDLTHFVKIIPFRKNAQNQVEELIAYEIDWEIKEQSQKKTQTATFKNSSVLATGNWYKIAVTKTGVYKIDKTFLKNIGLDIDNINPKNLRIYGNGGHMLPEYNGTFRYDDLEENAIQVIGESDNVFNANDYVLFYGIGTDEWRQNKSGLSSTSTCLKFTHQMSLYSDTSYYYITADMGPGGKRISDRASLTTTPTNSTSTYDYLDYHEKNSLNFIKSGRIFYGEYFDINTSYSFSYPVPNLVTNDTIWTEAKIAARSNLPSNYSFSYNGITNTLTANGINTNDYLGDYVGLVTTCNYTLVNNPNLINLTVTKLSPEAIAWLDYIVFNCRRNLVFNGSQFALRDSRSCGSGKITQFIFNSNNLPNINIWDISDPVNIKNQLYNSSGSQVDFTMNNDTLKEYALFNGTDYYSPSFVGKVVNQNLHAIAQADYIIVTNPLFLGQAQRLALIHQQADSLTYAIATTEQVYNEFSSGKQDITAIRDFVRMLYKRNLSAGREPKYLLLFGDGSYKVKDRSAFGNTSFIPVWENLNSENPTLSTVSDDFFAWMDDNEGNYQNAERVDVGVGRFPVKNGDEATNAVNKVEAYYKKNYNFTLNNTTSFCSNTTDTYPLGDWRNTICFVADDEDGAQHMKTADLMAGYIKTNYPAYNIDKLYADAFLQYSTPGGQRYPDISEGLDHKFAKGALIINYTGHGGEVGLGHERYLEVSQIQNFKNINNMPLFITATCEFSRFDDPDRTSAGELCFLNGSGGAIALLTTVRVAYTNTNEILLQVLYQKVFKQVANFRTTDPTDSIMPTLGDLVRDTKYQCGVNLYYLNFHLLGDPALRLAYPQQRVYTTVVNNHTYTAGVNDTIKALQKVTVKGYVGTKSGAKMTNFNGVVFPTVYDKNQVITCLGNDYFSLIAPNTPYKFNLQRNVIYKGKVQVVNGDFSFTFIVPKDITYSLDTGKISYYAHNGIVDANGFDQQIVIGGSSSNFYIDNAGPTIGLYLNDKKFVSGGTTNENPNLYAEVADSSGINTVGTGIGHDISAIIDENSSKPIILNDYYEADLNSYQTGKIKYPFSALAEGNHRLSLKVWDVQNNSNIAYTDFVVAQSAEMALTHVLNYPNPFTTRTQFFFENNQCCLDLKVNIQVFTISGKVVKTISKSVKNEGFRSDGIEWDGKDDYGDKLGKGVYIYKVSVSDADNKKAEKIEKLVILN